MLPCWSYISKMLFPDLFPWKLGICVCFVAIQNRLLVNVCARTFLSDKSPEYLNKGMGQLLCEYKSNDPPNDAKEESGAIEIGHEYFWMEDHEKYTRDRDE